MELKIVKTKSFSEEIEASPKAIENLNELFDSYEYNHISLDSDSNKFIPVWFRERFYKNRSIHKLIFLSNGKISYRKDINLFKEIKKGDK